MVVSAELVVLVKVAPDDISGSAGVDNSLEDVVRREPVSTVVGISADIVVGVKAVSVVVGISAEEITPVDVV